MLLISLLSVQVAILLYTFFSMFTYLEDIVSYFDCFELSFDVVVTCQNIIFPIMRFSTGLLFMFNYLLGNLVFIFGLEIEHRFLG